MRVGLLNGIPLLAGGRREASCWEPYSFLSACPWVLPSFLVFSSGFHSQTVLWVTYEDISLPQYTIRSAVMILKPIDTLMPDLQLLHNDWISRWHLKFNQSSSCVSFTFKHFSHELSVESYLLPFTISSPWCTNKWQKRSFEMFYNVWKKNTFYIRI